MERRTNLRKNACNNRTAVRMFLRPNFVLGRESVLFLRAEDRLGQDRGVDAPITSQMPWAHRAPVEGYPVSTENF